MATRSKLSMLEEYRQRTPGSAELAAKASTLLPSGIAHDSRWLDPYPIYVERAAGSRKWDVDGNSYVDYSGGHGALLLGHNHPQVVAATQAQLGLGTHFGSSHPLEVRWAELVQKLVPSAARVRFTSSGTEATHLAVRLARAFTGRPKLIRFRGHFHGWHDHMAFGVSSHFGGTPSAGVLPAIAENVELLRAGDMDAVADVLRPDHAVAAVIVEPTGASWGQIPLAPDFLARLRELTAARGVLLIFDEVISGFRCAPGGAQQALGITPDLTTLAKILAGGLPGGAVAGRHDVMGLLDFDERARGGREKVPHQGTFNANPLSAAAGIATLEIIARGGVCERASEFAARLREALRRVVVDERVPWIVYGSYSGFHIFTNPKRADITAEQIESGAFDERTLKVADRTLTNVLRLGMLLHGVEIFAWPGGPTSAVHSDDDLEQTVDAFRATIRRLREEGTLQ